MAKLTASQQNVLDLIKSKIDDEDLISQLQNAIISAKEEARKSERGPRKVSHEFTARDAKVLRMRLVDNVDQVEIENMLEALLPEKEGKEKNPTAAYTQIVRSMAWKVLNILLTENHLSKETLSTVLDKHATVEPKENKPKDKMQPETEAPHTSADSVAATDDEVAAALAGE